MAVLVTGGAGYIGSHTVRLLHERGHNVVAFDSMEFGHAAAVGEIPLVRGDVGDSKAVEEAIERYAIDSVVHFAAYKSPGESMSKPQLYFANNVAKTASLIDTLHNNGVTRIVFSSTCAVYGTPERVPVGEDSPIQPESPYGESKAMTERVLWWYDRCFGTLLGQLALLQRRRRLARRIDWGGLDGHHQPRPTPHEGSARS